MSESVRFIVVRHAESEWNQRGILQGQLESPTSARGLRQIDALLGALDGYTFNAVIGSPSRRALTTAQAIAQAHSATLHLDPRLHEQHLGDFQALSAAQILEREPAVGDALFAGDVAVVPPGGESVLEAANRLRQALLGWKAEGDTCVVTHGNTLAGLLWLLDSADFRVPFTRYSPHNCSYSTLIRHGQSLKIENWGLATHLLNGNLL
ncbi:MULTISPECIES: histidine phosphatase family protein [Atlantibacter]|uniref:histidine phosphatase family protein n=1 Tax=Atlantibacter TaxID=1903434 RepID=UPI0016056B47|nr:histidine phosphatase family protein [Atlantibacter sp.]MBB3322990.1 putative phosphoglycerate mutase [Atlantibacter sp. RC6]MBL7635257.1 histidine phosphatase family protein [Atlantibacter hermannii]MBL7673244.1 histidine phosphatase family protein [Atlantibacter hermannii]